VLELARAGADVAIADIDLESAEATAKEVEKLGRRTLVVRMDVTDTATIADAVARIEETLGEIAILVNNAGVVQDRIGVDLGDADFDRCYQVNLKGIWNCSTAVIPHFQRRGGGRIVNIASIAGRRGSPILAAYSASKAGAISLTQSLAAALGPQNVNVNAVCPGLLWTDMWAKIEGMVRGNTAPNVVDERAAFDAYLEQNCPLRREQTPADIGHAVAFLVSDRACNITGQALNVDGGIEMN
jgi:NAD(P)-dependent dehydrogenase (short-subunit alcohol dehydrogenase family)